MQVNSIIESLYQQIGAQALAEAQDVGEVLLLYAEVEDGVSSADMFYRRASSATVKFLFGSSRLQDLVVSLWENWKSAGNPEWRTLSYTIEGGKFNIDLSYPDQVNASEDLSDRRPRAVKKYFGDAPIDYSSPRG